MGIIQQLDEQLINQIAAGEVIERPASVIKELIENALDANSTEITITLKNGGLDYIAIQDNGKGMSKEDLLIAPLRHTTSKLKTSQDLFAIKSLGFRGEALASICSVAHMSITTHNGEQGFVFDTIQNQITPKGAAKGTTVEVQQLFYNTPARKKYMKTPASEFRRCVQVVEAYALAYPKIGFQLTHNELTTLNLHPTSPYNRIVGVLGKDLAKDMIPLESQTPDSTYAISGYIGKPQTVRKDKRMQYFFVNKRLISSTTLSVALSRAYEGSIHQGTYASGVIFLTIAPRLIDVNVHPTKAQIRFEDEKSVFRVVYHAVQQTLQATNLLRKVDATEVEKTITYTQQQPEQQVIHDAATQRTIQPEIPQSREQEQTSNNTVLYPVSDSTQDTLNTQIATTKQSQKMDTFRVLGLANKKYIIAEKDTGIIMIDFHAAHERINFERLKKLYENKSIQYQQLMQPTTLSCSPSHIAALEEHKEMIMRSGFEAETFGSDSIIVRQVPIIAKKQMPAALLLEVIDNLIENKKNPVQQKEEEILTRMACRSSYMAGDELTTPIMTQIINDLHDLDLAFSCPHGRPIMIELGVEKLDKLFERIR